MNYNSDLVPLPQLKAPVVSQFPEGKSQSPYNDLKASTWPILVPPLPAHSTAASYIASLLSREHNTALPQLTPTRQASALLLTLLFPLSGVFYLGMSTWLISLTSFMFLLRLFLCSEVLASSQAVCTPLTPLSFPCFLFHSALIIIWQTLCFTYYIHYIDINVRVPQFECKLWGHWFLSSSSSVWN